MPRLALFLLGPPRIERDGVPVQLDRRKAMALLAYLAVTAQSHRRDSLVNLLWPDYDSTRGRAALRRTLHALSSALGPHWLDIDREEIGLAPGADPSPAAVQAVWADVNQFRHRLADCATHGHPTSQVCPACVPPLTVAVALVRGEFLSGFSLKDSFNFDDWQLFQAEALRRELAEALDKLVGWHSAQREFEPALAYARHRLALDPLDEAAHQELMRLYAWSGRRSAALRQYDECVAVLQDQLGVPPQDGTRQLHDEIQAGRAPPLPTDVEAIAETGHGAALPSSSGHECPPLPFLTAEPVVERPVFVAREPELAQLAGHLSSALAGQGRVVFVTGEAGCGKTALIQEFTRRALEAHTDASKGSLELRSGQAGQALVVAIGNCNAYTGIGDPYLPFREILALMTGDVEARWAAGAMTREHVRRLWHTLPLTAQALVQAGPDLIDAFVPRAALLARATTYASGGADWLTHLRECVEQKPAGPGMLGLQQSDLFEQYTRVLQALARQIPLLLVVDDLQWADLGSISLLFHLGRHLAGSRILIVGAYRPEEVTIGRDGERHPLEPVVNECQRRFGDITVNLDQAESRDFVEALLDSEPNRLGDAFREMLYHQTRGHPLFTVELLRGLQERGDLLQDPAGQWVEGPALNRETLPARIEAAIRERIDRLAGPLQATLRVASVEGEVFTAEVVTRVLGTDERTIVQRLSSELERRHRLVRAHAIERLQSRRVSRYRFGNYLFQRYLYDSLDQVERTYLHEDVGYVLEDLYGDQAGEIAVQLAWHFQEAGVAGKAIHYLHQAGEKAVQLSAYQEAITHLTQGLALLMTLPDSPERAQQELTLQLSLGWAQLAYGAFVGDVAAVHGRARELGQQTGRPAQLCLALGEMAIFHYVRSEHRRGHDLAEEGLIQAQRAEDPLLVAWSRWHLGITLFGLGEYALAREQLEQVIAFFGAEPGVRKVPAPPGADAGASALAYLACCLLGLGYPEQASQRSQEALALARELGQPFTLADVLCYGGCVFNAMRRDAHTLQVYAAELLQIAEKIPNWFAPASMHRGTAMAMSGQVQEGIAQIRASMAAHRSQSKLCDVPRALGALAAAQAKAGRTEEGLATLAEALSLVEETDERYWEAELYRLKAELLLMQPVPQPAGLRPVPQSVIPVLAARPGIEGDAGLRTEAEASLHKAIDVARRQQAKSWELRATTRLCRLWQAQGRTSEARQMLAAIYDWFTEGFDTPDLQEAKALLDELS